MVMFLELKWLEVESKSSLDFLNQLKKNLHNIYEGFFLVNMELK